MFTIRRTIIALGLGAALVSPLSGIGFAQGNVDARANDSAATSSPNDNFRTISKHGRWAAFETKGGILVGTLLADGAIFVIAYDDNGHKSLGLSNKAWHLVEGKTYTVKLSIDGQVFSRTFEAIGSTTLAIVEFDKAIMPAIYHGRNATIAIGGYQVAMDLPDAATVIDDVGRYYKVSAQ